MGAKIETLDAGEARGEAHGPAWEETTELISRRRGWGFTNGEKTKMKRKQFRVKRSLGP